MALDWYTVADTGFVGSGAYLSDPNAVTSDRRRHIFARVTGGTHLYTMWRFDTWTGLWSASGAQPWPNGGSAINDWSDSSYYSTTVALPDGRVAVPWVTIDGEAVVDLWTPGAAVDEWTREPTAYYSLPAGVRLAGAASGNVLYLWAGGTTVWRWNTTTQLWLSPLTLTGSAPTGDAAYAVGVDPDGNVVLVRHQSSGGRWLRAWRITAATGAVTGIGEVSTSAGWGSSDRMNLAIGSDGLVYYGGTTLVGGSTRFVVWRWDLATPTTAPVLDGPAGSPAESFYRHLVAVGSDLWVTVAYGSNGNRLHVAGLSAAARYLNAGGVPAGALFHGWWDGSTVRGAALRGWWSGSTIRELR